MNITITREDILRIERQVRREEYIEEGAYDGRLNPSYIPDKKREKNRRKCRSKIKVYTSGNREYVE